MRAEVWAWLILLAALRGVYVFISETLAGPGQGLWFFFSSDTVQYGLIHRDLFEDGFHFAGWNISHAPEYLQMASEIFFRSLTSTLAKGHVIEALTQPILLALALRFLLSKLWARAAFLGPLVVALILVLVAHGRGVDFIAFVWSNRHGYTAILSVLALALMVRVLDASRRPVLLALVVGAGMASDMLFLVWFVTPALAATLLLHRSLGGVTTRRVCLTIALGAILGLLAFWAITPSATVGSKLEIQLALAWGALNRMVDVAFGGSIEQTAVSIVALLGFGGALIVAVKGANTGLRVAALYAALMALGTVLAVAATAAPFREAGYTRYLLAPQLAGLVVVTAALVPALGRFGVWALVGTLSLAVLPGLRRLPETVPPATEYYPPLVSCLDDVARRHRLEYGVADYWLAKYVTALSRNGLRVMAVTPRLDPFVDFTNIEWFLGGVGARRHDRPAYTFAILGSNRPEDPGVSPSALAPFGDPLAVETCAGYQIRVLPLDADERIRRQFRENRRIKAYYAGRGLSLP